MNTATTGNEGCQCINQTSLLSSLQKRDCITTNGKPGVYLTLGGSCVPYNYGSTYCLQHDLLHDPICNFDASTTVIIPPYCLESWCYVDAKTCKRDSEEAIYKTKFFVSNGDDLFYSYSTCNSTDSFSNTDAATGNVQVVGGLSISADIPNFQFPMLNKQLDDGTLLYKKEEGDTRYFNDTIPFGGLYVDYLNTIKDLSNGDIQNVTYTHTSKASLKMYPTSSFTAAVQDVENGLVDMALGPFWITGQRLKMTTFTVPLVYDKTVLVIPKPGQKKSLGYEVQKVLEPFTYSLWGCAIAITVVAALLSVWFSDRELLVKKRYGKSLRQKKQPRKRHKGAYLRLVADAILEKGMFFFSAGIEQDQGASLPHKILMFGFGFFILIAVSAYVANLAAFLTQTGLENTSYGSMKQVSEAGIAICGHPALEAEIRLKWPDANWLFPGGFYGPDSMFEAYARGDCKVLAVGVEDTILDVETLAKICENNLVYTDSVVTENPIAFPVKPELASALSYWMYLGEKIYGVNLDTIKEQYIEENGNPGACIVKLSDIDGLEEVDDFTRVSPSNMFLPIMLFVFCAFVGIILQLVHERKRMLGKTSSIGRKSTLAIFENVKKENRSPEKLDDDDWGEVMPRARDIVRRRTTADSNDITASARSVQLSQDFPGINIPIDSFEENGGGGGVGVAPQSPHGPTSIFRGSIDDMTNKEYDSDAHNAEEDTEMNHRVQELVESGVIEEVLDCFDFFQEMKKLKKNQ